MTLLAQFAATGGGVPQYIEDVFSTWLYTGNNTTLPIVNGIDLSTKGGMIWTKSRSNVTNNAIYDTARGVNYVLRTNTTVGSTDTTGDLTSFNTNGYTIGTPTATNDINAGSAYTFASWTFREQAKFFDVVTYTGTGSARTVAHSLGSIPGCIIVKRTDTTSDWQVYHRSISNTEYLVLNSTAAKATGTNRWNSTDPTSTVFTVGTDATVNASGGTYVAYIFAHDSGGFGLSGSDNVISCGSFTTDGSGNATVSLGYEPQWLMVKASSTTGNWQVIDNMRGFSKTGYEVINANTSGAASAQTSPYYDPSATGFSTTGIYAAGVTVIYIAIRRGPMKVPTTGTSVFGLSARTGTGANATVTGSAGVSDAVLVKNRGSAVASLFSSRLTGTGYLVTSTTAAEVAAGTTILQANPWDVMDGVKVGTTSTITNASSNTFINYLFDRAPGFFDEVCYTGNASTQTITHNLTVAPELLIWKNRTSAFTEWATQLPLINGRDAIYLNRSNALASGGNYFSAILPTATTFSLVNDPNTNQSSASLVAWLFASCPGVSKVGSYTGTGTTQTINCGFTAGARFVLIKRTDDTGDWYVWDSARGIIAGNDPYWLTNSDAAEVTGTDYVDTAATGFELSSTAPAAINANGGSFIFLAIS
jgi:hypothetical protein